jgi:AcrR family transcriptional regulator
LFFDRFLLNGHQLAAKHPGCQAVIVAWNSGDRSLAQTGTGLSTSDRKQAREQRILDAASTLILRQGYRRTSMAAIAREAGVGKGTLYLHWARREDLFTALIIREKLAMAVDLRQRIAADPDGATLHGLLKYSALALMQRPLLKAVMVGDTQVFGELVARQQGNANTAEVLAGFMNYFQVLRQHGLVRADLSLPELGAVFSSIFLGFFLSSPLLPQAFKLTDKQLAELMAETGRRALEPRNPPSSSAVQSAAQNLDHYLDHSVAIAGMQPPEDLAPVHPSNRARGRNGGRPKKLKTPAMIAKARRLYADQSKSIQEICATLDISRASLYRYLKEAGEEGIR